MDAALIIKSTAKPIIQGIFSLLKDSLNKGQSHKEIEFNIENHITEVINWSMNVQFYGMHQSKDTDECTIDLNFGIPRKFRSDTYNEIKKEIELLSLPENLLILGDPGAGKTTTLKRLSRYLFLTEPVSKEEIVKFPILIKLRDIETSICRRIAKIMGIHLREEKVAKINEVTGKKLYVYEYFIGKEHVEIAIPKMLNKSNALLLVDGLDELSSKDKEIYESEISAISNKLTTSKLILTCRSGGYLQQISGFRVLEICSLDDDQINRIIEMWADDPVKFKSTVVKYPYHDTINRPLFLNQLIMSFNYYGDLPEQPADIYEKIINLMLIQWDLHRKVKRTSTYTGFNPEKKTRFLSAFAYDMTYRIKSKIFTRNDLVMTYNSIHRKFRLPSGEAELVAEEIESYTGIISKTVNKKYEFSHLSLQEYLCASYIVREPVGDLLPIYLEEYSPPIAIAVAISSSPERLFSSLILREKNFSKISDESLITLLTRLLIEDPIFTESLELGMSFIKLFFRFAENKSTLKHIEKYLECDEIMFSIGSVMMRFSVSVEESNSEFYHFIKKAELGSTLQIETPKGGKIPKSIVLRIAEECCLDMVENLGGYIFSRF